MNEHLETVKYDTLPICLKYHPLSELSKESGYYPNINQSQLKCCNELIHIITKECLDFNTDEEDEFLKLLRFARARKFNVKQALAMIKEDIRWRAEKNRLLIRSQTATEILNCDLSKFYQYFPVWIQGVDKQLRPVSYRQFGKLEIWNVLKLTSLESLIRFHAWETEQALRLMYQARDQHQYNIETFLLVCDAKGWNLSLATSDAFAFIKGMVVTDADHYPERLGTLLLVNAPSALSFAWRIIQGFIDSKTKEKIHILGSNTEEWKPILLKYIDLDQIPVQYGGTFSDFTADEAISSMNPPTNNNNNTINNQVLSLTKNNICDHNSNSVIQYSTDSSSKVSLKTNINPRDQSVQTDDGDMYVYSSKLSSSSYKRNENNKYKKNKCIIN